MLTDNTLEQLNTDELKYIIQTAENIINQRHFFNNFNADIFTDTFPNWEFINYEHEITDDNENYVNTKIICIMNRYADSWTKTSYTCRITDDEDCQFFCNNELKYTSGVNIFDLDYKDYGYNKYKNVKDVLDKFAYIYSFTLVK